jgi:MipA family protein
VKTLSYFDFFRLILVLFYFISAGFAHADPANPATPNASSELPKWEIGAGAGYLKYEQYPGSNQYSGLFLPFPTFQYRGKILRADERDGARLYLIKRQDWVFQFGGVAYPPLAAGKNDARQGMADLPTLVAIGPQLQLALSPTWSMKFGVYQAIAAIWLGLRTSGAIWETDFTYREVFHFHGPNFLALEDATTAISLNFMGASQEVQDLYFGVPSYQATPNRATFDARSGFFQTQLSFFQSLRPGFDDGKWSFYFGGRLADYSLSANHASPLLRSDQNLSLLIGLTYIIYKSKKEGTPEDSTTGVVDRIEEKIHHHNN